MDDKIRVRQLAARLVTEADFLYLLTRDLDSFAAADRELMLTAMQGSLDELETLLQVKPK